MILNKIFSKSGIKKGLDKAPATSSSKVIKPIASDGKIQTFKISHDTSIKINSKPIKKEFSGPVATIKKVQRPTIDLDRIKHKTKLLRADVDLLVEMLKAD